MSEKKEQIIIDKVRAEVYINAYYYDMSIDNTAIEAVEPQPGGFKNRRAYWRAKKEWEEDKRLLEKKHKRIVKDVIEKLEAGEEVSIPLEEAEYLLYHWAAELEANQPPEPELTYEPTE